MTCGFLATPLTGRDNQQYVIAGVLLAIGVVLWAITVFVNRQTGVTGEGDPANLAGGGPVN